MDDDFRAGAARYVLDAALAPSLLDMFQVIPEPTRRGLVEAMAARASASDARRLEEVVFPAPITAPRGTTLVGASRASQATRAPASRPCS